MGRTSGVAVAAGVAVADGEGVTVAVGVVVGMVVGVLVGVEVSVGVGELGTAVGLATTLVAVELLVGSAVATATAATGSDSTRSSGGGSVGVVQPSNRTANNSQQPHARQLTNDKQLTPMRPSVQVANTPQQQTPTSPCPQTTD